MTQIGYAAVKTAGIRSGGDITETDLAEVVRRHLEDLCRLASNLGVPRGKLFTHVAGWKENELLYQSGLNRFICPGWSFYKHAGIPRENTGVQTALQRTDAAVLGGGRVVLSRHARNRAMAQGTRRHAFTAALPLCMHLQLGKRTRQRENFASLERSGQ
jgi:hypothetical protein